MSTDRSRAFLGLQKRLARTFRSKADYGIVWIYFERLLLWRAETRGGLSRIEYTDDNTVPSWSWMACEGRIKYLDIPFSQVSWLKNPTNPFGAEASLSDSWDGRLHATANALLIGEQELLKRVVLDCDSHHYDRRTWRCVVLGKSKVEGGNAEVGNYALLIRPISSADAPDTYERVGAGILWESHFSSHPEKVEIV